MTQEILPVLQNEEVSAGIFRLTFRSKQIAAEAKAGQFLNVRVSESVVPVLRRPFSISEKKGESFSILFNIVGTGTRILAEKKKKTTGKQKCPKPISFSKYSILTIEDRRRLC